MVTPEENGMKENGMKISVKLPHEEVSFWKQYISGKAWVFFWLCAVGILMPIVISILPQYERIKIDVKEATLTAKALQFNLVHAALSSVGVVVALALLYSVHCWLVRRIAYEDRKRAKDREDFISGQIGALKDIILSQQGQQGQRISQVEVDVRYHDDTVKM